MIDEGSALAEWNQLRKACADHGTTLILRAETLGDFRFSLAARDRQGRLPSATLSWTLSEPRRPSWASPRWPSASVGGVAL